MKPFKTYFDAYTSLAAHLKQAADEVFREHKNQPNYTAKLNLAIINEILQLTERLAA